MPPQRVICTAACFVTDASLSEEGLETHASPFLHQLMRQDALFKDHTSNVRMHNMMIKLEKSPPFPVFPEMLPI